MAAIVAPMIPPTASTAPPTIAMPIKPSEVWEEGYT